MPQTIGNMAPLRDPDVIKQAKDYCAHQANKGIDSLVALMQRTGEDWKRCLDGVSDTQAAFSPAEDEWTTQEVVAHFLQATGSVNDQIRQVASGQDVGALAVGTPDKRPGQTPSVPELSAATVTIFEETAELIRALDGNPNLGKQFPHPAFGQLDILQWIAFQRMHGVDHMRQIEKNKSDAGYPA